MARKPQADRLSSAWSRVSAAKGRPEDLSDALGLLRPIIFEIKAGMKGRTGRPSDKAKVLTWLDKKAAGRPITPALKEMATKHFGSKVAPRYKINRWLRERK
jgi:hypothetical protein